MVWFFERAEVITRLTTSFENATREYVIVIESPDETVRTERFTTEQAYRARLAEIESELRAQGWAPLRNVALTANGWPGPSTRRR
jgi:hypothetical protein